MVLGTQYYAKLPSAIKQAQPCLTHQQAPVGRTTITLTLGLGTALVHVYQGMPWGDDTF